MAAWSDTQKAELFFPMNITKGQGGEEVERTGNRLTGKMDSKLIQS